ncbi:MAG: NDP-sugar synthase [Sulfolobaceae archaeon]
MSNPSTKVIIPIGGEATRLRPLTVTTSKATVRILNRPLLEFPILEMAKQGFREFIFGVRGYINYRSLFDTFKEGIGFSARYKIKPRLHFKYQPRIDSVGNAHSVFINLEYYDIREDFVVIQGDNIFKLDFRKAFEFHKSSGAIMTIVLKEVENVEEFGVAELQGDRIINFIEKPPRHLAPSNLVNTGIYIINPKIREIFSSSEVKEMFKVGKGDFGKDIIPYLLKKGYEIRAYITKDIWFDVGTPERYLEAMKTLLDTLDDKDINATRIDKDRRIFVQGTSPDSKKRRERIKRMYQRGELHFEGSILIGGHCQIGGGTYVEESSIDNFTIIGKKVRIIRSSIMDRNYIGDGAIIENSILGRHVEIRSSISKPTKIINSVLGDDVVIGEGSEIINSKIYPSKIINAYSKLNNAILT